MQTYCKSQIIRLLYPDVNNINREVKIMVYLVTLAMSIIFSTWLPRECVNSTWLPQGYDNST